MPIPVFFQIRPDEIVDRHGPITDLIVDFLRERIAGFFGTGAKVSADPPASAADPYIVVVLSTLTPLFDEVLLAAMIDCAARRRCVVLVEGAVGGTAPVSVAYRGDDAEKRPFLLRHDGQDRYNAQLGLTKQKQIKVFGSLRAWMPDLTRMPLGALLDFLGTSAGVDLVLAYGEEIAFDRYDACPGCGDPQPVPLRCHGGQPRIGFLTRHSVYYAACGACGLVFLNPVPREQDLWKLYDWYDKERLTPISEADFEPHRLAGASYARHFEMVLDRCGPLVPVGGSVVDLGGGSGAFATLARGRYPGWSIEVQDFDCSEAAPFLASRGIRAVSVDFTRNPLPPRRYDLITLFEVIEHLRVERLKSLWPTLHGALRPGGLLVFSTPDFASPYARLHDFWAAFAPHHITVLSSQVLEPLWRTAGFETLEVTAELLLFRPEQGDFDYYRHHAGSLGERASAEVLRDVSLDPATGSTFHAWRRGAGHGGEMLVVLRRRRDA